MGRLLLARLELDRGLWNETATGCSQVPSSDGATWQALCDNAARFRNHPGTRRHLNDHALGAIWRLDDQSFRSGARGRQLDRLTARIAYYHDLAVGDLPVELPDVLTAYLDALPVGAAPTRKVRQSVGRLRPDLRLIELFDEWRSAKAPSLQSADEYRGAVCDFIDLIGDIAVVEISHDDLLDFRDENMKLPAAMPRADRRLPFSERVARHEIDPGADKPAAKRVGPATVKKRVGGVQALLSFAHEQKWIKTNVGRDVPIIGYSKRPAMPRQTFDEEDLVTLFCSPLFVDPASWSWTSKTTDCSLYWLFLINATTGARIEEVGQALLADVKIKGGITYIDIDDYANDGAEGDDKSIKTPTSRRLVPVHDRLLALGFNDYCDALRAAGHDRLFPDLQSNGFGKRTQDASKRANRYIDAVVSRDARLVFHSFRHGFKDLATEAEIQDRVIDQICGHKPTTVGGRYGRGVRLPVLQRLFHKVDWNFMPWDVLTGAAKIISWPVVAASYHAHAKRREQEKLS